MRVLVIGGSGFVGSLVLAGLARQHTLRIFDVRPPGQAVAEYVEGTVGDPAALVRAAEGMDALLYMAMGSSQWETDEGRSSAFDVNVKGLYLALHAAQRVGIGLAVYTSTMSIYDSLPGRYFPDEEITPDARGLYGLTKRLGEEVCRNAAREWPIAVNALRLCYPLADDRWLAETRQDTPTIATAASDVCRALLAALEYRNGFAAFMISGDYQGRIMNMSRAKRLLGWEPRARPRQ